jgi:hypothetical protein
MVLALALIHFPGRLPGICSFGKDNLIAQSCQETVLDLHDFLLWQLKQLVQKI